MGKQVTWAYSAAITFGGRLERFGADLCLCASMAGMLFVSNQNLLSSMYGRIAMLLVDLQIDSIWLGI